MVISEPIWALIPHCLAAKWKRGAPYTPFLSRSAMAGISRCEQISASPSGRDAPSRKLKAEREWSSTYINCQKCQNCQNCHNLRLQTHFLNVQPTLKRLLKKAKAKQKQKKKQKQKQKQNLFT